MPPSFDHSLLLFVGVALAVVGLIGTLAGVAALFRARPLRFVARTLAGLVLLFGGLLALAMALGAQGYRTLTGEQTAARIFVHPTAPQRFEARVVFPEGREARFELSGDEIYVDAHILKWKPLANIAGLQTAYELDRIGGRYRSLEQERAAPRSLHALAPNRPVDMFDLRRRYAWLAPLVDAEYGSASFVPVNGDAELQVRVSTTGLLIRQP